VNFGAERGTVVSEEMRLGWVRVGVDLAFESSYLIQLEMGNTDLTFHGFILMRILIIFSMILSSS